VGTPLKVLVSQLNAMRVGKCLNFQPVTCYISETTEDRWERVNMKGNDVLLIMQWNV